MDWAVFLDVRAWPQYAAVLGMLGLAAFLLWVGIDRAAHRVFALVLVLRAFSMLAATLRGQFTGPLDTLDADAGRYWAHVFPYFVIPLPLVVFYFVTVYPKRRVWVKTHAAAIGALSAAALTFIILYARDHSLFYTESVVVRDGVARVVYNLEGPLAAFTGLMYLSFAILAFVFAWDYLRLPEGPTRKALLLAAFALTLSSFYDGTASAVALFVNGNALQGVASVSQLLTAASLVPAALGVALLGLRSHNTPDARERRTLFAFAGAMIVPIASGAVLGFALMPQEWAPGLIMNGLWRLALPILVTYALVRYQLFEIDVRMRWTLKQSTLAGLALLIFFVVSELLEGVLADAFASWFDGRTGESVIAVAGLGIAVALTYALTPVQRMAERLSGQAIPHARNTAEYFEVRRLEIYQAAYEGALLDGRLSSTETRVLERLRQELGLTRDETLPVEGKVRQAFEAHAAGRGMRRVLTAGTVRRSV